MTKQAPRRLVLAGETGLLCRLGVAGGIVRPVLARDHGRVQFADIVDDETRSHSRPPATSRLGPRGTKPRGRGKNSERPRAPVDPHVEVGSVVFGQPVEGACQLLVDRVRPILGGTVTKDNGQVACRGSLESPGMPG